MVGACPARREADAGPRLLRRQRGKGATHKKRSWKLSRRDDAEMQQLEFSPADRGPVSSCCRPSTDPTPPGSRASDYTGWLPGQPQAPSSRETAATIIRSQPPKRSPRRHRSDNLHVMENASNAFLDAARKSMRQINAATGAATVDPELLTAAKRIRYEGLIGSHEGGSGKSDLRCG